MKVEDRLLKYGEHKKQELLEKIAILMPTFQPTTCYSSKHPPGNKSPLKNATDIDTASPKTIPISALTRLLHKMQDDPESAPSQEDRALSFGDIKEMLAVPPLTHSISESEGQAQAQAQAQGKDIANGSPKALGDAMSRGGPYGHSSVLAKYLAP